MKSSVEELINDLARTTEEIISLEELKTKLNLGKKLIIKYGADCTAPFLHLGHAVNLWMMRRLQEEGHKVIFLLGDFTTKIGDPTGRSTTRPLISDEDIEKNAQEFLNQVGKVLITNDSSVFEVKRNSTWFKNMTVQKFLSLISMVTHSKMASRDMFQKRLEEGRDIYMHEMLYPILQGYDSVELKSDCTIVGTDQLFNESLGRFYQEKFGEEQQVIITTKITPGLCGKVKQSKSLGNYIAIVDSPRDKYGKTMSLPDSLILQWMEVYTDIPMYRIESLRQDFEKGNVDFRNLKMELAKAIVARYHGIDIALEEEKWFIQTFSSKEFPADAPTITIGQKKVEIIQLLKKCIPEKSNSELRKLVSQGAVRINDDKVMNFDTIVELKSDEVDFLRVGKRSFFKIRF